MDSYQESQNFEFLYYMVNSRMVSFFLTPLSRETNLFFFFFPKPSHLILRDTRRYHVFGTTAFFVKLFEVANKEVSGSTARFIVMVLLFQNKKLGFPMIDLRVVLVVAIGTVTNVQGFSIRRLTQQEHRYTSVPMQMAANQDSKQRILQVDDPT